MNGEERTVDLDVDDNACLFQLLVGRKVSKGLNGIAELLADWFYPSGLPVTKQQVGLSNAPIFMCRPGGVGEHKGDTDEGNSYAEKEEKIILLLINWDQTRSIPKTSMCHQRPS